MTESGTGRIITISMIEKYGEAHCKKNKLVHGEQTEFPNRRNIKVLLKDIPEKFKEKLKT